MLIHADTDIGPYGIHITAMNNRIRLCVGIKMLQYGSDPDATIKDVSAPIPDPVSEPS